MRSANYGAMAALGLLAVSAPQAAAQERRDLPTDNGVGVAFTVENDVFVPGDNTDRYYTQGMKLAYLTGDRPTGPLVQTLVSLLPESEDGWRVRTTMGLGHHMYTPEDYSTVVPDPTDRPYAGWLYGSYAHVAYSRRAVVGLELQAGIVGPDAHAGFIQNWWHANVLSDAAPVNGWASELDEEIGLNAHGEWRYRLNESPREGWDGDVLLVATAALGNVDISAGGGAIARLGYNLGGDFGPPRLRPGAAGSEFFSGGEWSAYAFAGVYGRAVGRDIFLDGNTFGDSPSVERERWVPEYTLGAVVRTPRRIIPLTGGRLYMPPIRFGYTWVKREQEFVGQRGPSEFGALTITVLGNGLNPFNLGWP